MTCSCLGTKRRGFSAHMSCTVTLRPFASACASRAQNDIPEKSNGRHLSCLSACGHKTASTNTPPRVVRFFAVDTARSTIKPRSQKRTVSANPCGVFTNVPFATLSHRRAHLCWRRDALPVNWHLIWNGERVCATSGVQRRRDNQRRTDEATCTGKPRPAIKLSTLQVYINQAPLHAHGASNHTMDTTGTYNPLKLRWHALTWKPTANGEHPTKPRDASQFLRCRTKDTHTTTDLVNEPAHQETFLTIGKNDFVPNERRTLPKTHRTRNIATHATSKKDSGNTASMTSIITSHVRSTKM